MEATGSRISQETCHAVDASKVEILGAIGELKELVARKNTRARGEQPNQKLASEERKKRKTEQEEQRRAKKAAVEAAKAKLAEAKKRAAELAGELKALTSRKRKAENKSVQEAETRKQK